MANQDDPSQSSPHRGTSPHPSPPLPHQPSPPLTQPTPRRGSHDRRSPITGQPRSPLPPPHALAGRRRAPHSHHVDTVWGDAIPHQLNTYPTHSTPRYYLQVLPLQGPQRHSRCLALPMAQPLLLLRQHHSPPLRLSRPPYKLPTFLTGLCCPLPPQE